MASIFADIHRSDVVMFAGICVCIFLLGREAHANLESIRKDNQITPQPDSPPEFFNATTEDTIAEQTIETLAASPNPDMASAANRMLVDRILRHPKAYDTLLANARGVHGRETQEEALATLKYLFLSSPQGLPKRDIFWLSLVATMRSYLPDVKERSRDPVNAWRLRSQGERDALLLLGYELDANPSDLVKATNLVVAWIALYPFDGTTQAHSPGRKRIVHELINSQTDDVLLSRVLQNIHRVPLGRKHLRIAGLIGSANTDANMTADTDGAPVSTTPPYSSDSTNVMMPPESPRLDPLNPNEDAEARLRRRRRNAVVFEDTDTIEESDDVDFADFEE